MTEPQPNADRAADILGEEMSHDQLTAATQAIGLVLLDIHHALEQIGGIVTTLAEQLQPQPTIRHVPVNVDFDEDGVGFARSFCDAGGEDQ